MQATECQETILATCEQNSCVEGIWVGSKMKGWREGLLGNSSILIGRRDSHAMVVNECCLLADSCSREQNSDPGRSKHPT